MTYRDDDVILRERIERLELSLVKSAGQAMLLAEERDALRAELAHLTRDPRALSHLRGKNQGRSALYVVLRILGGLGIGLVALPMMVFVIWMLAQGEFGVGLACSTVPLILLGSVMLLKLPAIVTALELRVEQKQRERRARELSAPQVRVATDADEHEELGVERHSASMRHRR